MALLSIKYLHNEYNNWKLNHTNVIVIEDSFCTRLKLFRTNDIAIDLPEVISKLNDYYSSIKICISNHCYCNRTWSLTSGWMSSPDVEEEDDVDRQVEVGPAIQLSSSISSTFHFSSTKSLFSGFSFFI